MTNKPNNWEIKLLELYDEWGWWDETPAVFGNN